MQCVMQRKWKQLLPSIVFTQCSSSMQKQIMEDTVIFRAVLCCAAYFRALCGRGISWCSWEVKLAAVDERCCQSHLQVVWTGFGQWFCSD